VLSAPGLLREGLRVSVSDQPRPAPDAGLTTARQTPSAPLPHLDLISMQTPSASFRFLVTVAVIVCSGFMSFGLRASDAAALAGKRTLMLGDSITQNGLYVTFLEYYLHRLAPSADYDLISIGLSSETVAGLSEPGLRYPRPNALDRLDAALAAVKPQIVFACYGMNDGIYHPLSAERLAAYEAGLDRLIAKVRGAGASLVLITPPIFDPLPIPQRLATAETTVFGYQATYPGYNDVLQTYAAAGLRRRAADVAVIDLHAGMRAALAERRKVDPAFTFCPDGVHPNELGHLLMGRLVARGLGLNPPEGALETELSRIHADPLFPLVRDRRALRSEAWLSFVGYTHATTIKSASVRAAEVVVARLQAEIDALTARP